MRYIPILLLLFLSLSLGGCAKKPVVTEPVIETISEMTVTDEAVSDTPASTTPASTKDTVRSAAMSFALCYFDGNEDGMAFHLRDPSGPIEVYEGNGSHVSIRELKGFPEEDATRAQISVEFLESSNSDSCSYLSLEMAKIGDSWKILSYGLEK